MLALPFLPALLVFMLPQQETLSPPNLKAALVLRVIELEKGRGGRTGDIDLFVLQAPQLAEELETQEGRTIGKAVLGKIRSGSRLPQDPPDVLFIGSGKGLPDIVAYARSNRVMTITDRLDAFQRGVAVCLLTRNRRQRISIDTKASEAEGLEWTLDAALFDHMVLEFAPR